jgi:hypothetical protein
MKEHLEQINHLAEVLYNESKDRYTIARIQAKNYQDIIDELQEHLDSIVNELMQADSTDFSS